MTLSNVIIPTWGKYVAGALLISAVWGHGWVKGVDHAYGKVASADTKLVYKQGKITTRVITKYVKAEEKILKKENEIKEKGQSYAIKFPNDKYEFNNYFVGLYDSSITQSIPSLSSRDEQGSSGVEVSEALPVMIENNLTGHYWERRALKCEDWAQSLWEDSVK